MEVLVPGSGHALPSAQPPIKTSGIFLAHMSGNSKHFWGFSRKKKEKSPPSLFYPKTFFCDLKLLAKFQNHNTTPFVRKVCDPEKKIILVPQIVDTMLSCDAKGQPILK